MNYSTYQKHIRTALKMLVQLDWGMNVPILIGKVAVNIARNT